jgi:hypothetical protein
VGQFGNGVEIADLSDNSGRFSHDQLTVGLLHHNAGTLGE